VRGLTAALQVWAQSRAQPEGNSLTGDGSPAELLDDRLGGANEAVDLPPGHGE